MADRRPDVLLVETNSEVLHVVPLVLERTAIVTATSDLEEACRIAARSQFQVLVMSSTLADVRGVELVRAVRGRQPCAQVMVLCEDDTAEISPIFAAEGVGDALVKPFDVGLLASRIRRLLDVMHEQLDAAEQLRTIESRLRHTESMAMLGTLVATLAHDLANPLSMILANGVLMADLLSGEDALAPSDRAWLQVAITDTTRGAEAIKAYVDRLLRYSRGQGEEQIEVGLAEVIRTSLLLVRLRSQTKGVVVHSEEPALAPRIPHQPIALTQALVNALSNAIDAAPSPGNVWLRWEETSEEVTIVVEDDGPGLTDEQKARFFEPFYTTKSTGTGLGTVVMRRVMDEHQGRIVLGRRGEGTGLSLRLVLRH